jgi:perosamine synthetase
MSQKLAIRGGTPVRKNPFPLKVPNIQEEERQAVMRVLDSDKLSGFAGYWKPGFFGGPNVLELEKNWSEYFEVKHSVAMNSATSCLMAAIGAVGIEPGDEVIVSPYSMHCSATVPLWYGGIPVFADIDPETFCISAKTIREKLSSRTKAVIIVDLFGNVPEMDEILRLCEEKNLFLIEDAAQAPDATYKGRRAGLMGHIGVFSFNVHKHMTSGEGGIAVTNSDYFAERMQLIRNHGEGVVRLKGTQDISNILGANFRITEIEAALANEQLKKINQLVPPRRELASYLTEKLAKFPGITPPKVSPNVQHSYYNYGILFDEKVTGIPRKEFCDALIAEGIPMRFGYELPIYLQPMFQQRICFGRNGFPWKGLAKGDSTVTYEKGLCPNVERIEFNHMIYHALCHAAATKSDMDDIVTAFDKVLTHYNV